MQGEILNAKVNGIIASCFVGVWVLAAGLIIWHVTYNQNPVADAFVPLMTPAPGQ